MRVSRLIAQRGAMSRRQADAAIAQGRVTVDASPARVGDVASSDADIVVDGRHVRASGASDPIIWLAYKKRGEAVERERSSGRDGPPSVFSRLNLGRHACAVGRLDVNSEGLLVLTSCGMLARAMEHPDLGGLKRVYDVTVNGFVTPNKIAAMRRGVTVDKVRYKPLTVAIRDARPKRATLTLTCREGKNRMIRRICDHLRLRVSRLRRVAFGPFSLRRHLPDRFAVVEARVPASLRRLVDDDIAIPIAALRAMMTLKLPCSPRQPALLDDGERAVDGDAHVQIAAGEHEDLEARGLARLQLLVDAALLLGRQAEDEPVLRDRVGRAEAREGRCLLYTSPSPRDKRQSRMPSSA